MWELIGLTALVLGIVAVALVNRCGSAIRNLQAHLDYLTKKLAKIERSPRYAVKEKATSPQSKPEAASSTVEELLRNKTKLSPPPEPSPEVELKAIDASEPAPEVQPPELISQQLDRDDWAKFEKKLGEEWTTWIGAVVLFVAAGLFVKYAFDQKWLGPSARVVLGVVAGIILAAAGERFIRRRMRPLGQGLIGAGLAILYASLYAAYGLYNLLPQQITFLFMIVVTIGGMALAVLHDALAISFIAVLGGFLTPILIRTGRDPRDALFSYLILLDLGVLGVAFLKRWRALDVLAFLGTLALFTAWYIRFHDASTYSIVPTMLWLSAFYVIFLVQPFVYHLRLATPITGERFFLAVLNAMGMFAAAYTILHPTYKHTLGLITIGMSGSYLLLAVLARKRIKSDERAVFGFTALSVTLLTIAVPIHLDFNSVTVAWAVKAPLLLYLAYRYDYFPVRAGCLTLLALAAARIFTTQWPWHWEPFTPILNTNFATAMFVALAGAAYAAIHHLHKEISTPEDRTLKIITAIASAFFALLVTHIEIWQWLDLAGREQSIRWAVATVWITGAVAFGIAGFKLRSEHSRISGLVALVIAAILCSWDYTFGAGYDLFFFNGRFLAALVAILVLFAYAVTYRLLHEKCTHDEERLPAPLVGIGIFLLILLTRIETWQCLSFYDRLYAARCFIPLIFTVGAAAYLATGLKLRSPYLRSAGPGVLLIAAALCQYGYGFNVLGGYAIFFNGRFCAALAVVLMAFAHAFTLRRFRNLCTKDELTFAKVLYGIAIALLFILLNAETHLYFSKTIADPERARWITQMSLSIIWGLYAAAMLAVGFWRNGRILRFSALALFGLTALKLLIIDMATVEEVYRIISFFVLGTLMIAASYVYHHVEKKFFPADEQYEEPQ